MATDAAVLKVLKQYPDESVPAIARRLGEEPGAVVSQIYRLEPEADPSLAYKGPKTDKAMGAWIVANSDLRWERLAARTGESVSRVKELYEMTTGKSASSRYSGLGRRYDGSAPRSGKSTAGSGTKAGRGKSSGTSGRRGAAAKTGRGATAKTQKQTGRGRRGTRASASDPK